VVVIDRQNLIRRSVLHMVRAFSFSVVLLVIAGPALADDISTAG
jgi:hypothetical protein